MNKICSVFQFGDDEDNLLLCDNGYVINGGWNYKRYSELFSKMKLIGYINHIHDYNETLNNFQNGVRSEAPDLKCQMCGNIFR